MDDLRQHLKLFDDRDMNLDYYEIVAVIGVEEYFALKNTNKSGQKLVLTDQQRWLVVFKSGIGRGRGFHYPVGAYETHDEATTVATTLEMMRK